MDYVGAIIGVLGTILGGNKARERGRNNVDRNRVH